MAARLRTQWFDARACQRVECFESPAGRYHKITTSQHAALNARASTDGPAPPPMLAACDCRLR
jgi:hypothetical protein